MDDVSCPYCGKEQEINHDDGYGYDEERMHEQECVSCEKIFGFKTTIIVTHEAYPTPCKNTNIHPWKLTKTFPKEFSRMRCEVCEEERPMTEEERISNNIGTAEAYFEELDRQAKVLNT